MILWGLIVGALIGWGVAEFDSFGLFLGAALGAAIGAGLRKAVRQEIARANEPLLRAIEVAERARAEVPAVRPAIDPEPAIMAPIASPAVVPDPLPAAVPPEDTPPPAPAPPGIVQRAFAAAIGWLLGGNTIVRAGLVILFVGLSFLARYAAGAGLFPVELRLALVAAAGIALLAVGFRQRAARPPFALLLQGAGVAVLYLAAFAGALMEIVPVLPAFAIMIVVGALGVALALLQNAQGLAVASFVGGYAVPLLLVGEGGATTMLFGFYTLLNVAVLAIAQRRSWRIVNLVGFFATFGMAALWMAITYRPALYPIAQGFLIVSVLIYVAAALGYARNTPGRLGNVVDSTLLFGPALAGFGLQAALVADVRFGAAFSALGFAALYLAVAAIGVRRGHVASRTMTEATLAIAIGFVTLAIPLALGVRWTGAAWALEGAGAFWVGMRQARWVPRLFGLALQVVAGLVFLGGIDGAGALPFANPDFVGAMLVALPSLAIAWWLRRPMPDAESRWGQAFVAREAMLARPAFLFGFAFWCLAFLLEIGRVLPVAEAGAVAPSVLTPRWQRPMAMLALVASAALWAAIGRRRGWAVATWPSYATLPVLVAALLGQIGAGERALATPGWAIWPLAIALHARLLYLNDVRPAIDAPVPRLLVRVAHIGGVWLLVGLLADLLALGIDQAGLWQTSWAGVVFLVSATAILLALTLSGRADARRWPLDAHADAYRWLAAVPVAATVFVGSVATALIASGRTAPLPFVPLLNPVDLALGLALATLALWRRMVQRAVPHPIGSAGVRGAAGLFALGGLAFVIVNSMWLRIAHHLLGVRWDADALLDSFVVQTGLAILWTLLALALMLAAHRRRARALWLAGAGLLGLVVLKLLMVDLSNAGGGERIVTFIVVGVLMLVVGYVAPLPPRGAAADRAVPA